MEWWKLYFSPTCHQRTSTWCTYRIYIIVVKDDSTVGKRIDIRCRYLIRSMKANVIPALKSESIHESWLAVRIEFEENEITRGCILFYIIIHLFLTKSSATITIMFGRLAFLELTQEITNKTSTNLKTNMVVIVSTNTFTIQLEKLMSQEV